MKESVDIVMLFMRNEKKENTMDIYTIMSLKEQLDDLDKKRIRLYNNIKKYCESLDPEYLKNARLH